MRAGSERAANPNPGVISRWIGILLAALRNIKIARRPRNLRLCETLQLGERRQLLLVEWESRRYLLGATQQGLSVLDSNANRVESEAGEKK